MKKEIYLKRSKSKGIVYYKLFEKTLIGNDIYLKMAGTAEAIYKKLVLLDSLKEKDQLKGVDLDQQNKRDKQRKRPTMSLY